MKNQLNLEDFLNPIKFINLLEKKDYLLTPVAKEKVYQKVKDKYEKQKLKESGLVFGKVLKSNELGIRPNAKRAGSFAFIAQQIAKDSKNGDIYEFIYDYHNSKNFKSDPKGRIEYRMYSSYIRNLNLNDIILMMKSPNSISDFIVGYIHPGCSNYDEVLNLINNYKVGRGSSALIPSLELITVGVAFTEMFDEDENKSNYSENESVTLNEKVVDKKFGIELPTTLSPKALADLLKQSLETDGVDRTVTILKKIKRDRRFRKAVLEAYNFKCAVTGHSIMYGDTLNVQAAHIKGKEFGGSDHLTNGLLLSLDLHWAFDRGFLAINEDFTIQVHEKMKENNILQTIERKKLLLPQNEDFWPDLKMIKYHRDNIFGKFAI
ncbi:HNH endonuclease [Alkalicoccobacillus plakortidis]|uniref:HNH endonuclease n=1 Tax=Alkalicoccobacillus plakortidis TaxID=444060 RepID=A0ABT0XKJ2_9BACI|nr:HNH endonuclease [Alkalicoccobacillus plakortidis]MCM2676418.1 HNH endonuclease [Alkalicoccobacillus plakortidis]